MLWSDDLEDKEHERMHKHRDLHLKHQQMHDLHKQQRDSGIDGEGDLFGSDEESSDEENEDARDKRLEREYLMVVIKSRFW